MNASHDFELEEREAEEQVNPYEKLLDTISEITDKVSGITKKYGLESNEVYNRIGFDMDNYRSEMMQIISSRPYCRKATNIGDVERYTAIMENAPYIMKCVHLPEKESSSSDINNILKEIDSTKDIVLENLESLERELS